MQQINFYQAQFKPKKAILPAWQFLSILGFVIVCLTFVSTYLYLSQPDPNLAIAKQKQTVTQKQAQIAQLHNKLASNKESPLLRAELNKLKELHTHEEALLNYVSSHELGNKRGFSSTLVALSEQHLEQIWLTEFSLLNAGQYTALKGQASSTEVVPKYIDSLAKSTQFKGKTFSVFNIQKSSDTEYFDFQLFTSNHPEKK